MQPAAPQIKGIQEVSNTKSFQNICLEKLKKHPATAHLLLHNLAPEKEGVSKLNKDALWLHVGSTSQEVTFSEDNRKIYIIKKNQSGTTDSITKSIYWIEKPTVLLTAPWNNPNHLFWDVVVNFFVWKDQGDDLPFKYWSFPDHYPCHSWLCQLMPHVLKVLHLENHIKPLHNLENASTLTSNYPDSYGSILDLHHKDAIKNETIVLLPCYRNAWIPNFEYYRTERRRIPNEGVVLPAIRQELTKDFQQEILPRQQQRTVFIYGHTDSVSRNWLNFQEVAMKMNRALQQKNTTVNLVVNSVPSLAKLTFQEQCYIFWNAKYIFYVHGGHTANLICARPNTTIIEMSCNQNFGWSQNTKLFHQTMQLNYTSRKVPGCDGHNTNFITPESWTNEFLSLVTTQ